MNPQVSLLLEVGIRLAFNLLSGRQIILGAFFVGIWNGIVLQRATEPFVAYFQSAWFAFDLLVLSNVARLYLVLGCFLGVLVADFGPDVWDTWAEFQRPVKSRASSGSLLAPPAGSGSTIVSRSLATDLDGASTLTRGATARSQVTTSPSSLSSTSSVSTLRGDGGSTITRTSRVTFDEASIANSQSEAPSETEFGFPVVRTPGSSSTRVRSPGLTTHHSPEGSTVTESDQTPRPRDGMILSSSGSAMRRPDSFSYAQQPQSSFYAEELVDQPALPVPAPFERPLSYGEGGVARASSPYGPSPVTPTRERSRSPRPSELLDAELSPARTRNRSRSRSPAKSNIAPSVNDELYLPSPNYGPSSPEKDEQIRHGKDLRRLALDADDRQRENDVKRRQAEAVQNQSEAFLARLQATKEANASKDLHAQAAQIVFEGKVRSFVHNLANLLLQPTITIWERAISMSKIFDPEKPSIAYLIVCTN